MTALGLLSLWALSEPVRDDERRAVAALRFHQLVALPVAERERLIGVLWQRDEQRTNQAGYSRQKGSRCIN
jgi:hypothetical protein